MNFYSLVEWYTELFRSLYADYQRHSNQSESDEYWENANEALLHGYMLVEPTEAIDSYTRRIGDFASLAVRNGLIRKVSKLCGLDEDIMLGKNEPVCSKKPQMHIPLSECSLTAEVVQAFRTR